jgi:predicted TIM-barrel fold metal-dependent hydrolase
MIPDFAALNPGYVLHPTRLKTGCRSERKSTMSSSADAVPGFPQWLREVRAPVPLPPKKSCDCQAHVFGDPVKYPPRANAEYAPLQGATFDDLCEVERTLGFERFVIVHAQVYGTDFRLVTDYLEAMGDHSHIRLIGRIDDSVSDRELERLHGFGFRGVRFGVRHGRHGPPDFNVIRRTADRVRSLGWHLRLHLGRDALPMCADELDTLRGIRVSIDHLGYVDPALGPQQPACRWIADKLRRDEDWWLMLSNGNRLSPMEEGYGDAIPIARAYIEAAPDRLIWGTDWPHVQWRKQRMMNDAEEVELLYRYVEHDAALLQKILVDNPARLHGFEER